VDTAESGPAMRRLEIRRSAEAARTEDLYSRTEAPGPRIYPVWRQRSFRRTSESEVRPPSACTRSWN